MTVFTVSIIVGFFAGRGRQVYESQQKTVPTIVKEASRPPMNLDSYEDTLAQLLAMTPEQLEGTDIAILNLACGQGFEESKAFSIKEGCKALDQIAEHVRKELARSQHQYDRNPKDFFGSRAYFNALLMVCILQEDAGIHYRYERIFDYDYTQAEDSLILGLLGPNKAGTCASMPVLYVAIGRRLGFPMKLVSTQGHVFARWESPDGRQRFNIEGTGHGMASHDDDYYKKWPYPLEEGGIKNRGYLKSMTSADEFALFLGIRGDVLDAQGKWPEAKLAKAQAARYSQEPLSKWLPVALLAHKERLAKTGILDPANPKNPFREAKPPEQTKMDMTKSQQVVVDKDAYKK